MAIDEISLVRAAHLLHVSWAVAYRMLLEGELEGRQGDNGRWYVTRDSLQRISRERRRAREGVKC